MSASHQHPDTLPNALAWADRAACRGYDLDAFFTDSKGGVETVKRVCRPCQVREQCLAEALRAEYGSRYGIYGGLTPDERTELVGNKSQAEREPGKPKPRAHLSPCGTDAAYRRHLRYGEQPCKACREANAERLRKQAKRLATCGTRSGYRRHRKNGEEACDACRAANSAADRRLRTTGSTKALR